MHIKWIRTFVTAATYENFHKAAEKLFLAQPTVSVHIKQLEKELGMELFTRTGRQVQLTSLGRQFLNHAQKILDSYDQGMSNMEWSRQGYYRKLTLAVSPLIATTYLPYWIRKFVQKHADVEIVINVIESHLIAKEVEYGLADIGLSRMNLSSSTLSSVQLMEEKTKIICPHDGGALENSSPIYLESLIESQVLLTHNHPDYWDDLIFELRNKFPLTRTMKVSQVHVTKKFIEEGFGFSILPLSTVRRELAEGRVLEVESSKIALPRAYTYLITKYENREISQFIQTILSLI